MKKILSLLGLLPIMVVSQTQTENYIKTTTYKVETAASIASPSSLQANQTIGYYDGLGRPVQSIAVKQGGKDRTNNTLLDWKNTWTIGNGSVSFFNQNGDTAENARINGVGPFGNNAVLWQCVNDAASDADGGWNSSSIAIDKTASYRYAVWVKRTGGQDGYTYHGTQNVVNLDGTANTNPYFWYGNLPALDTWYLMIGMIHPASYTGDYSGISGVYDTAGNKVISGTDFKWSITTVDAYFRSYLYYATNTATSQYFYNPTVQKIDGSEASIAGLASDSDAPDIVTHMGYDGFGRQDKEYLPYAINGSANNGLYRTDALAATNSFYNTPTYENTLNPFSEKHFEASPLNRVLEQGAPGADWAVNKTADTDHTIKFDYQTNTDADQVRRFGVSFVNGNTENPYLEDQGIYDPSQLYKTITKDENWVVNQTYSKDHTTEEFKDKEGRVVLKRTFDAGKWHDTYYVYDDYGNLTYVLSPKVFTYHSITQPYQGQSSYYSSDYSFFTFFNTSYSDYAELYLWTTGEDSLNLNFYEYGFTPGSTLYSGKIADLDFTPNLPDMTLCDIMVTDVNGNLVVGGVASIQNGDLYFAPKPGIGVYPDSNGEFYFGTTINLSSFQANYTPQALDRSTFNDLIYQYKYDKRNRLVEKKLPGKEWEYIVYDKLDRPVLTQDANLKTTNKWLFTKYDAFSRPVYTGEYVNVEQTARTSVQALADMSTILFETKQGVNTINGTTVFYGNNAFPNATDINLFTINYYDDYNFDLNGGNSVASYNITSITNATGLATGSKVRILGTTNWTTNVSYYDAKGRSIYSYSKNDYLATTSTVKSQLDFVGKTLETTSTHQRSNVTTTVVDAFIYDQAGRLTKQTQAINGTSTPEVIVANTYDELGQLTGKKVGGKTINGLQKVDYTYNIRGWLKSINDPNNLNQDNDLFAFGLNYNTIANTSLPTYYQNKPLYNGNISGTSWKTNSLTPVLKQYNYTYDALNRFKVAWYAENNVVNNKFYEVINGYDRNGNIMGLNRQMQSSTNANYTSSIDYLTYAYDNGNRLMKVNDSYKNNPDGGEGFKDGTNTGDDYSYDVNGNMTIDQNKGIIGPNGTGGIAYNHFNLPTKITFPTGTIDYVYDATGAKQRKIVSTGTTTDYAGGFQYENNVLQFFPQPEGYVDCSSGNFNYIYQYKDHLGNVRLSYADKDNDGVIAPASPYIYQTVWEDDFESATGWDGTGASWGHPLDAFDTAVKHSGNRSGRMNVHNEDPFRGRSVHSTEWIAINNIVDTQYRISGWVFIENIPQWSRGRLELMMKKAGETEYTTLYENQLILLKGQWVYVEKTITVPAYIKSINSRITFDYYRENVTTGSAWFDDLKIEQLIPNSQNEIVEENNYYPFGLKHKDGNNVVNSTNPGQKYKYNGKEFQDELGLNFYDYGARNYDPALGRWMNVDPLAEKYPSVSPYVYCLNNPLIWTDPTGMIVEPGSQKEWDSQKKNVTSERDRLQQKVSDLTAKGAKNGWNAEKLASKIGDKSDRITSLNGSLSNLGNLEKSTQVYALKSGAGGEGGTTYDSNTGNITFSFNGTANFVHETTHGGQFESGNVAFSTNGASLLQDLGDETSAYKAQFAYDPSSVSGLSGTSTASSFSGITGAWVQGLNDAGGNKLYGPGGSANTGITPININSTKADLMRAYPGNTAISNLPANLNLQAQPTIYYKK